MTRFEFSSLWHYQPPAYVCKNCFAIIDDYFEIWLGDSVKCPICSIERYSDNMSIEDCELFIKELFFEIKFKDPLRHGIDLASNAYSDLTKEPFPPINRLLKSIKGAENFIHFITYGLSKSIYGALKLKALEIPIRGIVSNISNDFAEEISENKRESWQLNLIVIKRAEDIDENRHIPHQKLIVIDGMFAIKGSANMTEDGWRKISSGLEMIETITDQVEAIKLNNDYFSNLWGKLKKK